MCRMTRRRSAPASLRSLVQPPYDAPEALLAIGHVREHVPTPKADRDRRDKHVGARRKAVGGWHHVRAQNWQRMKPNDMTCTYDGAESRLKDQWRHVCRKESTLSQKTDQRVPASVTPYTYPHRAFQALELQKGRGETESPCRGAPTKQSRARARPCHAAVWQGRRET